VRVLLAHVGSQRDAGEVVFRHFGVVSAPRHRAGELAGRVGGLAGRGEAEDSVLDGDEALGVATALLLVLEGVAVVAHSGWADARG